MPEPQRRRYYVLIQTIPTRVIVRGKAKPNNVAIIRATVPTADVDAQALLRERGFRWLNVGQVWHLQVGAEGAVEEIDALDKFGFARCEPERSVVSDWHSCC